MNLIPRKSPGLLCNAVNQDYTYAVNCFYPSSFRLLNNTQLKILNAVNGNDNVSTIAERLKIPAAKIEQFLFMLSKTQLIAYSGEFTIPARPAKPSSLNLWIHTTNACNLGCSYCYISTLNTGKGMSGIVRQQLVYKLIEAAENHRLTSVKLRLAGGEPLGHFNSWKQLIAEAIPALLEVDCKLEVAFITNLTMLTDEIVEFAKEHRISFGVSLDGVNEIHDATRQFRSGAGSFDIVDKNLRKLIDYGLAVSVNTVVSNSNLAGLPQLTQYLIGLNIPFRYSVVKGDSIDSYQLEESLTASYEIMRSAIKEGWQFSRHYQFCDLKPNDLGFQTCASGFSGGAIYIDGAFKYCHVQFGKKTESDASIFDLNRDLLQLIKEGEHHEDKRSEDCLKCRYRSICTSGCPVYRINDKDPQCSIYHKFIPKYYELQAIERLHVMQKCEIL